MPTNKHGQLITFAVAIDADDTLPNFTWVVARAGDTPLRMAALHGQPEEAQTICQLNHVRRVTHRFPVGAAVLLPGNLKSGYSFSVLPQDMQRPTVGDGYALYNVQPRIGREGIAVFDGYNPIQIACPVQFKTAPGYGADEVARDIALLERMAGRGDYRGAGIGEPATIRVSVTDARGNMVPLIGAAYQWSPQNPSAPLWRVGATSGGSTGGGIAWDASPTSDHRGRLIDAKATIYLVKAPGGSTADRSVTRRARKRAARAGSAPTVIGTGIASSKTVAT